MKEEKTASAELTAFHLPRYHEIPTVGLYLKQVVKLINEALPEAFHLTVTDTMLSNYVKLHLIASPVKKMYSRDQIASLILITLAKSVLSLDNIQLLLRIREENYEPAAAYDYFCSELEAVLQQLSGQQKPAETAEPADSEEKELLHNVILAAAHKFYLEACFARLAAEGNQ